MNEHKYADILRAIADGKQIQCLNTYGHWNDINCGAALYEIQEFERVGTEIWNQYRVKPEKVYPVTSYTEKELGEMWMSFPGNYEDALVRVANAAIKRYIDEQGE